MASKGSVSSVLNKARPQAAAVLTLTRQSFSSGTAPREILAVRNEFAPFQVAVTALKDVSSVVVRVGEFAGEGSSSDSLGA